LDTSRYLDQPKGRGAGERFDVGDAKGEQSGRFHGVEPRQSAQHVATPQIGIQPEYPTQLFRLESSATVLGLSQAPVSQGGPGNCLQDIALAGRIVQFEQLYTSLDCKFRLSRGPGKQQCSDKKRAVMLPVGFHYFRRGGYWRDYYFTIWIEAGHLLPLLQSN
jgi:hypothetical protein